MRHETITAGELQEETQELFDVLQIIHALDPEVEIPMSAGGREKASVAQLFRIDPRTCRFASRVECLLQLKTPVDLEKLGLDGGPELPGVD
jgi:hypothetical protein